jgi:hypothetical protein
MGIVKFFWNGQWCRYRTSIFIFGDICLACVEFPVGVMNI